ncbi:NAD(P)-binding protein [Natrinema hispanicum]|uniref:NAD(P)-binding protein n=1 Tax=Natrinema hispanicum TaxID=392421 RepID=UPI0037439F79
MSGMESLAGVSVVVIGGGIGGLSTACYLADAGADVRVIEKKRTGGWPSESPRARRFSVRYGSLVVSDARCLRAVFRRLRPDAE